MLPAALLAEEEQQPDNGKDRDDDDESSLLHADAPFLTRTNRYQDLINRQGVEVAREHLLSVLSGFAVLCGSSVKDRNLRRMTVSRKAAKHAKNGNDRSLTVVNSG
jgi:hypothetical protein